MLLIMSSLCVLSAGSQCLEQHWHLPTHRHTAAAVLNIHFYRPCSQHHLDMTRNKNNLCQFMNQSIFLDLDMTKHIVKSLVLTDNALSKYRNAISNDPFFISWADCSTKTRFPWSSIWINVLKIPPIDSAPKTFDMCCSKYTHFEIIIRIECYFNFYDGEVLVTWGVCSSS